MRPLDGIVVRVGNTTTDIKLSNGGVIPVPTSPGFERGTKVEVDWDYTRNKVRAVWLRGKRLSNIEPEGKPININDFGKEIDKGLDSKTFTAPTFVGVKGSKDSEEPG